MSHVHFEASAEVTPSKEVNITGSSIDSEDDVDGFGPPPAFPTNKSLGKRKLTVLSVSSAAGLQAVNSEDEVSSSSSSSKHSQTVHRIKGGGGSVNSREGSPSSVKEEEKEGQKRSYDDAMADILDRSGDHLTMVHLFDLCDHSKNILTEDECRERFINRVALKRALDVRNQLARFLSRRFGGGSSWFSSMRQEMVGSNALDTQERSEAVRKCICAGYFMNAAKLANDGCYYTLRGRFAVSVSSSSVLHRYGESSDYILFGETFDGSSGGVDVMPCSSISGLWLRQLAPHYWSA